MILSYIEEKTESLLKEYNFFKAGFNIESLCKKLGINVIAENFNDDISGLFVASDKMPIISYNKNEKDNQNRVRFTIAHELGHYILHSKEQPIFIDKQPKVMYRNANSTTGELHKEREANAFAASLLMPRQLIRDEINTAPNSSDDAIEYLAKRFKVSEQAMSYRLANLGYDIL